jgi:TM2 domain-containing membrane protein YozV
MTTPPPQDPNYGADQPPQYGQQPPQYGQQPPQQYGQQPPQHGQQPYPPQQGGYPGAYGGQGGPGGQYGVDPVTGEPLSDKSKMVAGLLQILLGGFGAGRFYTGHTGIAIAQLVTCGGCGFWSLIDGIMILVNGGTDAQGRKLRDG